MNQEQWAQKIAEVILDDLFNTDDSDPVYRDDCLIA